MKIPVIISLVWFILAATLAMAKPPENSTQFSVLTRDPSLPQSEEMMRGYLRRISHQALDRRRELYESLKTREQILDYQKRLREFFLEQLGEFPEKTPLNARIVGQKNYQGFKLQKVIYESRPGFHVSALMYLPLTPPPYPGVLLLCGHTSNGKAGYQEVGVLMARNGLACLCPDPIGQGERRQLLDQSGQPLFESTTTEHNIEGVAPILLGRNIASYMVWDGIRSIDYLASRPDIDPQRIGCTGNSGGGNMTSFLMALDERIVSAAPGCFISTTRRKNESPGPGDAEQNIHAQTAFGLDHPDFVLMRAPKPTLILSATRDFVPIEGAWEAFRQAKRLYTRMGHGEKVSLLETDEEHGFSLRLREGSVRWMRRWLLGIDDAVTEEPFTPLPDDQLSCTPKGQVLLLSGARSVFDLNAEEEKKLSRNRERLWKTLTPEELRKRIREITGIRLLKEIEQPGIEKTASLEREGFSIQKLVLTAETGIKLPSLLYLPEDPKGNPILYLDDRGKEFPAEGAELQQLVGQGHRVLALDVRGIGETATTPWRYLGSIEWMGPSVAEFFIAYMLDKSFLGMRTEDILTAAGFLAKNHSGGGSRQIALVARGVMGPPALHAAALEPDLFSAVEIHHSLVSWSNAVATPVTKNVLVNTIHGALRVYDLPDLLHLFGRNRTILKNPVNAAGDFLE